MPSAADIESAAVEGVDVGLTKAARVARQRMFEGGERQPGLCQRARVAARQMRMEHPGGEGIAGADAVDDAGDVDFVRLVRSVPQVGARRDAVMIGGQRVARGRGDEFQVGEGGETRLRRFAPPVRAATRKVAARSEEHTSELQSLMRISYAVFCLKK